MLISLRKFKPDYGICGHDEASDGVPSKSSAATATGMNPAICAWSQPHGLPLLQKDLRLTQCEDTPIAKRRPL